MPKYTIIKRRTDYLIERDGDFFASCRADEVLAQNHTVVFFRGGYQIVMLHLVGEIEVKE